MPQPNGYRKALRFMRHADHFGFPIVTFVDTPGAFAGKAAEEQGQVYLGQGNLCGWSSGSSSRQGTERFGSITKVFAGGKRMLKCYGISQCKGHESPWVSLA